MSTYTANDYGVDLKSLRFCHGISEVFDNAYPSVVNHADRALGRPVANEDDLPVIGLIQGYALFAMVVLPFVVLKA